MQTGTVQQKDGQGATIPGLISYPTGWPATHAHATAADATVAAVATARHVVTGFLASSDKAGSVVSLKSDSDTVLSFTLGVGYLAWTFPTPVMLALDKAAHVTVDGTAACKANIFGYTLTAP